MREWVQFLHWVHDNIGLIFAGVVVGLFAVAWLAIQAFRSHRGSDEVFRLRQRLYELERDRDFGRTLDAGPVVLTSRWVKVGAAATTSDGGCFILVESASPYQKRAMMSVRVDGIPATKNQTLGVGERLEVDGRSGVYSIELHAADSNQARLAVALRTRHQITP